MDWDRLRIFHIVDAGSFSHASEEINTSQSAISRQVSNLEYEVGMPLFTDTLEDLYLPSRVNYFISGQEILLI